MQHTATHCNTLQHTATHCNTLQHTVTHRNIHTRRSTCLSHPLTLVPTRSLKDKAHHLKTKHINFGEKHINFWERFLTLLGTVHDERAVWTSSWLGLCSKAWNPPRMRVEAFCLSRLKKLVFRGSKFCIVEVVTHTLQLSGNAQTLLQHTATHCNTLQHTATHCNTLQHTLHLSENTQTPIHLLSIKRHPFSFYLIYSDIFRQMQHGVQLQDVVQLQLLAATHCNTLQHTTTHCNTLQHTATHCNTL